MYMIKIEKIENKLNPRKKSIGFPLKKAYGS